MKSADYLIIGNSAAGINAAESIRMLDSKGSIMVLSEEKFANYSKPLITYYLAGKLGLEQISYRSADFYQKNCIKLCNDTRVVGMDAEKKEVFCSQGKIFKYKKLLIASGGKPIIPSIEVNSNRMIDKQMGKIKGIYTLTTVEDACNIRKYIESNKIEEATVLGAGLIGLKAAEACFELGLNINLVELSDRILSTTFDQNASRIMESRIRESGGNIYTSNTIKRVLAENNSVKKLVLGDGKSIDCSLLLVAVGVRPNLSFIDTRHISEERGIKVSPGMQTSSDDVFAAGDVINSLDMLSGKEANIAIWPLAVVQGRIAGMNMAGKKEIYSGGFFMNSVEIMGIPSISMGLSAVYEDNGQKFEVLSQSDPDNYSYRKIVISNNRIVGLILLGNIERAGIYAGLIKNKIDIGSIKEHIIKEDFGLIQLPANYRKHLVVGEGIEV